MTADKFLLKMMMHSKTYFDWSKECSFYISQWTPLSQFQERRSTVLRLYDFLPPPDPEKDEAAKAAARCPAASQVALHLWCRSMQELVRSGLGGKTRLIPVLDVCLQTSAVLNVFLLRPTVEVCIQIVTANEIMVLRRSRKILGVLPGCTRQFALLYAWKSNSCPFQAAAVWISITQRPWEDLKPTDSDGDLLGSSSCLVKPFHFSHVIFQTLGITNTRAQYQNTWWAIFLLYNHYSLVLTNVES